MTAVYVLVVDDDELTLTLMHRFLQSLGTAILTAQDGEEALHLLAQYSGQIALIITDLAMPHMSGFTFAECVRSQPAYDLIPIIALTARVSIETTEKARQSGFTSVISKPFDPRKMRQMLTEYGVAGTIS